MDFDLCPAQRRLRDQARQLAQSELATRAAAIDRSEEYPWDNVRLLKEAGFFGMTIPAEYGGRSLTYFDAVLVIEQIAQACGVTARIVVEANSTRADNQAIRQMDARGRAAAAVRHVALEVPTAR